MRALVNLHRSTPVTSSRPLNVMHWALTTFIFLGLGLLSVGCGDRSGTGSGTTAQGSKGTGESTGAVDAVTDDNRIPVGMQLLKENRLNEAGMVFDSVLGEHPELARANFYKGLVLHRRQLHGSALSWYEAAMESNQDFPERTKVPYYAAWSYYYVGQMDKARDSVEVFLESFPDRADAHFLVGVVALEDGRMEFAQESLQRAIDLASGDPENERSMARAWVRLSDVHAQAGRHEEALAAVDRAIDLRPALSQAWFRKYTILMRLGDDEEAEFARKRWKDLAATGGGTLDEEP